MNMKATRWIGALAAAFAAVGLSYPCASTAQDDVLIPGGPIDFQVQPLNLDVDVQNSFVLASNEDEKEGDTASTEYWLGVQVAVVPELAKHQLGIDHGLAVEEVAADSPAAKAEIRKFDILLQAGETPLKGVSDLIKSVEAAKGKQIVIILKRDGESKKVEAVAEQKKKIEAAVIDAARRKIELQKPKLEAEMKQLEEALEKMKAAAGKEGFGMWFAKPAIVAPRVDVRLKEETAKTLKGEFPKDLSVQINKQGAEPTKIRVKRGDQEWEVTEDKVGELPEDVQKHVLMLLGKMKGPTAIANADRKVWLTPEGKIEGEFKLPPIPPMPPKPVLAPVAPVPPTPPVPPAKAARVLSARVERDGDAMGDKLDAIMKKLDKLEKEIDLIRDKK